MKALFALLVAGFFITPIISSYAGVSETTREVASDAKKEIKKGTHRVEEKACEMVNGKLECLDKKIKNRAEEVKDEVKDMAN
ncbi:hypothetical protein [Bdellovibrio sp. NC01]|uniref:hypothetical protein n=1 Tax=Bdellovibrio sp. NC01 TaxID=2220073 RepID=UPI00115B9206|nr:hypothetical protein [Bdellovibrio sp. NC01]QDK36295.1 hypothetical protein DOE51_01115 [Bdellovibrio sp. NC01]